MPREFKYLNEPSEPESTLQNLLVIIKKNVAENIWSRPLLLKYTDHGVKHSDRLIKIIEKIITENMLTEKKLNSYEIFILYASAFLHDIGMQITLQKKEGSSEKDNIIDYYDFGNKDVSELNKEDHEIIRKNHAIVSCKMIMDSVKDDKFKLGLNSNKVGTELAEYIADVCKHHQGTQKVDFKRNFNYHGEPIRLNLLCYLTFFQII